MARRLNSAPSYFLHKQSGRGRLAWRDALGIRHEQLLPGRFGSVESLAAKARLELKLATSPHQSVADGCSVSELLLAYIGHAAAHYRDVDGKATNEQTLIKIVCRHTRELYGDSMAAAFGPLALKVVRQKFIELGWCRKTVNQQIERLRRVFKWGVAEELVPPSVYHAIVTVDGLRRGRSEAPESNPSNPWTRLSSMPRSRS